MSTFKKNVIKPLTNRQTSQWSSGELFSKYIFTIHKSQSDKEEKFYNDFLGPKFKTICILSIFVFNRRIISELKKMESANSRNLSKVEIDYLRLGLKISY